MAASSPVRIALIAASALGAMAAGPALAQSMSTNSASYNAGYGRVAGQENQGVNPQMRDANGNLLVIDGIITNSSNIGLFTGGGVSSSASGAFAGGSTAIGNSLSVVTQGNNNTVIVDSRQINTGAVTATSSTSSGGNGS
jgi:holdfast attachment protein HfaA